MATIEQLREMFSSLPFARERRWALKTLIPGRLYLSRGETGEFSIFIEGDLGTFGTLPSIEGVQHTSELIAVPYGTSVSALHIRSANPEYGARVMAHIAYELLAALVASPALPNRELIRQIRWILPLLGSGPPLLSPERQRGLIGECILLRELLLQSREMRKHPHDVLDRWWGHSPAKRDFAAVGLAIEVKTTTQRTRQHQIGSLEQLEPQTGEEEVVLYSLGLKEDASSSRKLPVYVEEVEQLLISEAGTPIDADLATFRSQLAAYGYDVARRSLYDTEPGYLPAYELPGSFFREESLDRLRASSFVNSQLPSMVSSVSYVLNITAEPMPRSESIGVLRKLLSLAPVQGQ